MHKTIDFPLAVKAVEADGTFHGYGSVFGVRDTYDEIVAPGAFADSLNAHKAAGTMPAMLWQHRSSEPIGVYTSMVEDAIGLKLEGRLAMKTVRGAETHELLKMGALSGLSIGFVPREDTYDKVTGIRTLKKVDLWEVSPVTFPANDSARVQGVKTIEVLQDLKSAEQYLRDSGLSRREAVAFIASVKRLSQSESVDDEMTAILDALKRRQTAIPA